MQFEEWWNSVRLSEFDEPHPYDIAKAAWEAAWDQQQRVIDEMHLMFKDRVLVPKEQSEDCFSICGGQHEYCTCINKPKP